MRHSLLSLTVFIFTGLTVQAQVLITSEGITNGTVTPANSNELEFVEGFFFGEIDLLPSGTLALGTGSLPNDLYIDKDGNVGVGTSSPQGAFEVDGSMYTNGNLNIEPTFLNGIYFSDGSGTYGHLIGSSGGITLGTDLATGTNPSVSLSRSGAHFLELYTDGRTGVNTNGADPGVTFEIEHDEGSATNGLGLTKKGDTDKAWHMYVFESGNLGFIEDNNSNELERTLEEDGDWVRGSDLSLKSNIRTLGEESIAGLYELRATSYRYRTQRDDELQFGFIAQEVAKVFPDLVSQVNEVGEPERLGVSYEELIPITIAALQKQQQEIEERDAQLDELKNQVNNLNNRLDQLEALIAEQSDEGTSVILHGSDKPLLEQNLPNPFKGQTQIGYYLPEGTKRAQLRITAVTGQVIKTIELSSPGKGQVNVNTNGLASGTYQYSLLVDGRVIKTRQMVLNK